MKLEIYDEKKVKEEKKKVRLRLIRDDYGNVILTAVNKNGKRFEDGNLIYFDSKGCLKRNCGVNPDLGFVLDDRGRIKIED